MFSYTSIKFGFAELPNKSNWLSLYGVGVLTGIGFTMSLFVGNLAFVENIQYMDGVKIGVLSGSLLSTVLGYFLLLMTSKKMISLNKIYALLIILITIMFSFSNKASAEYDKLIYDFEIESITGEKIDFSKYKSKVILLVNVASKCGFTKTICRFTKIMGNI